MRVSYIVRATIRHATMKTKILIIPLLFVACCTESPTEPELTADDMVREAAFRHQIQWYIHDSRFKFIFLANVITDSTAHVVGNSDPSPELLSRFDGHNPPVKKFSDAYISGLVYDKETQLQGIVYRVGPIQWNSQTSVEFDGGDYAGNQWVDMFRIHTSKQGGLWVVDTTIWLYSS